MINVRSQEETRISNCIDAPSLLLLRTIIQYYAQKPASVDKRDEKYFATRVNSNAEQNRIYTIWKKYGKH